MSKVHEVHVTRDGRWWMVEVPNLDLLTQARRLSEVEDMAISVIALALDIPASQVEIEVHIFAGGEDITVAREHIAELRTKAKEAESAASELMRSTAEALADADVPQRDIGEVLGVSHQRVHQLLDA